jgi:hypothetical protein
MDNPIPPEVVVTELPTGVNYRLPPRQAGAYRLVGLALLVLGLIMIGGPALPTWKFIQAIWHQIPAGEGLLWLGVWILSFPVCLAGFYITPVGLFILAGHSEIELREGTLRAIECCGLVRWRWERSTITLRRLFVSESLEPLNPFAVGPLGTLCVITPEWKAEVGVAKAKPMWLAPGYPRSWLMALAEDLARRCTCPNAGAVPPSQVTVPVLEKAPDFSDYEELNEQPTGSRIKIEQSAEGLRLIVPPGTRTGPGSYLPGGLLCLMAFAFVTNLFQHNAGRDMPLWLNVLLFLLTGIGGISFFLAQANFGRRRAELVILDGALMVLQSDLFRSRQWYWSREQVADVFVLHHIDSDGPDHWELQIQPGPGEGMPVRLLDYLDVNELRWLATVLRKTLRCPGNARASPPSGLVVRSPRLTLRSQQLEKTR